MPEWLKGPDCKFGGYAYAGSNPAPPTYLFRAQFLRPRADSFGMEERKGTPIARWLESQMDPEQLARMRERQERLAWMRKWDAFVGWAWVGMLLVGGLVWLTLL
jgi:hypothetical protein